jgi:hypothetical protein
MSSALIGYDRQPAATEIVEEALQLGLGADVDDASCAALGPGGRFSSSADRPAPFPSSVPRRNTEESGCDKHSDDAALRHIDLPGPPLAPNLLPHGAQRPYVLRVHRAVGERTKIEQEVVIAGDRLG